MAKAKKLPSGSWRVLVYTGTDANGKRRYKSFTAATKREAEYLAAEFIANKKRPAGRMTVGEAIDRYIDSKDGVLSPTTVNEYRKMRKNYLQEIMKIQLDRLTQEDIQRAVTEEAGRHSAKTVINAHGLLASALKMQLPKDWRKILLDVMRQLGDAAERRARGETIHQMRTIILKCFRDAASAGVGEMLCSSNADYVEVIAAPEAEKADFIVRVSGDSMEPTFYDGDLLLCEEVADLEEGDIGVFRHNGTGYVKEYSKAGLISHNPAYDRIPKSRLEGLEISGKVLGIAQLVKF